LHVDDVVTRVDDILPVDGHGVVGTRVHVKAWRG
jgi:hypothetical protein